ncbi:DUF2691 family protein [Clostridium sp. 19966]|uniref:DUF2691 family protein n=1 Tax=Clostridium sp. 19966 TaxID=2768166 RepID=UPI0037BE3C5D
MGLDIEVSNCEMVVLCTDSAFIEFYGKNREILDKVYSNCINSCVKRTEFSQRGIWNIKNLRWQIWFI